MTTPSPRKPSPAPFLRWAIRQVPVSTPYEHSILSYIATCADPDGAAFWPGPKSIAEHIGADPGAVRKKLAEFTRRGLIREMPEDQRPRRWHDAPSGQRSLCREFVVPASAWSSEELEAVNAWRAAQTPPRPPILPGADPVPAVAPARKTRSDKGVPNDRRSSKKRQATAPEPGQTPVSQTGVDTTSEGTSPRFLKPPTWS